MGCLLSDDETTPDDKLSYEIASGVRTAITICAITFCIAMFAASIIYGNRDVLHFLRSF